LLLALQERGIACELVPGAVGPATID
jgi:hypothetical protein